MISNTSLFSPLLLSVKVRMVQLTISGGGRKTPTDGKFPFMRILYAFKVFTKKETSIFSILLALKRLLLTCIIVKLR